MSVSLPIPINHLLFPLLVGPFHFSSRQTFALIHCPFALFLTLAVSSLLTSIPGKEGVVPQGSEGSMEGWRDGGQGQLAHQFLTELPAVPAPTALGQGQQALGSRTESGATPDQCPQFHIQKHLEPLVQTQNFSQDSSVSLGERPGA